jgi:ribonuclease R
MAEISPHNQIALALAKHEVRTEFPTGCLLEAKKLALKGVSLEPNLSDWRKLPFVTIDNPDSRDLDQAMLIEREAQGFRLRYALADAAYFVVPGTALFDEALLRGATYYTPVGSVPMVPTELSEGLISLNPQVDRRALVFDISFDAQANIINTTVVKALIHSHGKLNYGQVQEFLDTELGGKQHELSTQPFNESLRLLKTLGNLLIQKALDRNVIPFNRREVQIVAGENGLVSQIRERYDTEKYNEQLSLACNMQGAQLLDNLYPSNDLQAIYRVHDAPLRRMQRQVTEIINAFADVQEDRSIWVWKNGQNLAEYVSSLPTGPEYSRRVSAIERQILISNRASYFTHESGTHHALAADSYARFSSPMREIVGIYTHKELLEGLSIENENADDPMVDIKLRDKVIEAANASRKVQKSLAKSIELQTIKALFKKDLELEPKPSYNGTIMGFKKDKLHVSLDKFASDIKVYGQDLESLNQTAYTFSNIQAIPHNHQRPLWQLGDSVKVSVSYFDQHRQRFVFNLEPLVRQNIQPT